MEEEKDQLDVKIDATMEQVKQFKGSILWRDIERELKRWLEMFEPHNSMAIDLCIEGKMSGSATLTSMAEVRGREKAINYILAMPDVFLDILEERKDDSRSK